LKEVAEEVIEVVSGQVEVIEVVEKEDSIEMLDQRKCIKLLVRHVIKAVKYHFVQQETSRYTAEIVL
jgi:hypothetical protein